MGLGSSVRWALPNVGFHPRLRHVACTSAPRVGTNSGEVINMLGITIFVPAGGVHLLISVPPSVQVQPL
jgi:hypothetical protein